MNYPPPFNGCDPTHEGDPRMWINETEPEPEEEIGAVDLSGTPSSSVWYAARDTGQNRLRPFPVYVDKKICVKGNWIVCPFCWRKWERGIDSLPGDLIECQCKKVLEVEAVEA